MSGRFGALGGSALGIGLVIVAVALAFSIGRFPVNLIDLATAVWSGVTGQPSGLTPAAEAVIFNIRGPRVLAAILCGSALAVAGAAFQGLFRNPLVSPDILGASSGAALGAITGIFFSLGIVAIQGLAFAGGLVAVALVYVIGSCWCCPGSWSGRWRGPVSRSSNISPIPTTSFPPSPSGCSAVSPEPTSTICCRCSVRSRSAPPFFSLCAGD